MDNVPSIVEWSRERIYSASHYGSPHHDSLYATRVLAFVGLPRAFTRRPAWVSLTLASQSKNGRTKANAPKKLFSALMALTSL